MLTDPAGPLLQVRANGELLARQPARHRAEQTKRLAETKQARVDRAKKELAALAAQRKAQARKAAESA